MNRHGLALEAEERVLQYERFECFHYGLGAKLKSRERN